MSEPTNNESRAEALTHDVIEALYDLPLGGNWNDVQTALCAFWHDGGGKSKDIKRLERHFQRALSLLERLPDSQNRWRSELHRIPLPAAVFAKQGKLVEANDLGKRYFTQPAHKELAVAKTEEATIRRTISSLKQGSLGSLLYLHEGAEVRLLLTQLPPTMQTERELWMGVFASQDLSEKGILTLREQYGLTNAEARLCLQLAAGASLDDIAQNSQVKPSTLRTHLKRSFSKVQVKSQPELVSVVLQNLFASSQLQLQSEENALPTRYLDPELHGYPKFATIKLSDGRKLGYFEYGDRDGLPALYLHGSLDSGLIMKQQKLCGSGVRLIAVERGGVGESTPNPDPSSHAYAQDLKELVDQLGLDRYSVIGRSMGSWDAVTLCQIDFERAGLLALVGGRLPVADEAQHAVNHPFYQALYHGVWQSDFMGQLMLRMLLLQLMVRGTEQFLLVDGITDMEEEFSRNALFQRHMKAVWQRAGMQGIEPAYRHLKLYEKADPEPSWIGLETPTLILHGDNDTAIPLEKLLAQTESFKQRDVVVFPGLGHRLVYVAMGEVLRRVASAWQRHGL